MQRKQEIQQKSRLGLMLIKKGMITSTQLDEALRIQNTTEMRLGEILIDKGWISENQLDRALKKQSRYRYAAALTAILLGPIQPFMASANVNQEAVSIEEIVENRAQTQTSGLRALSDINMGEVTAQGASANLEGLINNVLDTSDNGENSLEALGSLLVPALDLLDADMEMTDVTFADGERTTVNADGSIGVALPAHIGQIAFKNIRVQGSQGSSMGDLLIKDIDLSNVNVSIRLHN